jgi:hypothetical protein
LARADRWLNAWIYNIVSIYSQFLSRRNYTKVLTVVSLETETGREEAFLFYCIA